MCCSVLPWASLVCCSAEMATIIVSDVLQCFAVCCVLCYRDGRNQGIREQIVRCVLQCVSLVCCATRTAAIRFAARRSFEVCCILLQCVALVCCAPGTAAIRFAARRSSGLCCSVLRYRDDYNQICRKWIDQSRGLEKMVCLSFERR